MKTIKVMLFLALGWAASGRANTTSVTIGGLDGYYPHEGPPTYPVVLALSGGGARGFSAIGVLRAFEEKGIAVCAIAGTSIGGVVGGLYACGYSSRDLTSFVHRTEFVDLLTNAPARGSMFLTRREERERYLLSVRFRGLRPQIPEGLSVGQRLTQLLARLTLPATYRAGGDFTRLPIPFSTVATDVINGEAVVLSHGSLADAMRATIAFPLAFTGVEIDGRLLMDGGMVVPVPVDLARRLCDSVDFVVAVDNTSPLRPRDKLSTPVDIAGQVTTIMTADRLSDQLSRADIVIRPPLDGVSTADFKDKDSIIAVGYRAGLRAADSIKVLQMHRRRRQRFVPLLAEATGLNPAPDSAALAHPMTRRQLLDTLWRLRQEHRLFALQAEFDEVRDTSASAGAVPLRLILRGQPALRTAEVRFRFQGNHTFSDSLLVSNCCLPNILVMPQGLQQIRDSIISLYRQAGYDLANVRGIRIVPDSNEVVFDIDEGIIRDIRVTNTHRTRGWLVRSYFPLRVGQPYSTEEATRGIADVYGTDLFSRVTLDLSHREDGTIVNIGVRERSYTQLRVGWHWDDEYQSEQFLELLDDNVLGIGLELLSHAGAGPDRQEYYGAARLDRIFFTLFTARARAYYRRLERTTYDPLGREDGVRDERKAGALFTLGRQIARLGTVTGGLRLEHINYRDSRFPGTVSLDVRTIMLRSEVETLDRVPFPTRGHHNIVQLDLTGKLFGGDLEYTRMFTSLETYLTPVPFLTYNPKVSLGISRIGLPPTEQFYMGGLHSFSGLRTHQLAGDKLVLLNQEIRVRLPLRWYLTTHFDIGEVYRSIDEIKLRNLRHGIGTSLAFDSPLGPLEFGYGVELDSDIDRWYFRAGFSF